MVKVITYGTYDLFHEGHIRLLERAKKLGDYLIVGVTTENFDSNRGKLNVQESLMQRIENIKNSGLADEIIIEEFEGQKVNDILKYGIDIFAIGSDWYGKFDYLSKYCEVRYLERTKGISSTELRSKSYGIIKLGIIGYGRIATRFIQESKFVSGINVEGVYGFNQDRMKLFAEKHELAFYESNFNKFIDKVDAIYIASPHESHYEYAKIALQRDKHVLCEKPMALKKEQVIELYSIARENNCVILEAIKTAFSPGFIRLQNIAHSGIIGDIKNVDATFTKLIEGNLRELKKEAIGGSVTELASYPLFAFSKLLGCNSISEQFISFKDIEREIDLFTKINIIYKNATASAKIGLGVKSEGDLIISGTKGYIYVPSPWWKTEYFEIRFEDFSENRKHFYKFDGDGLRYEISEFISMINNKRFTSYKLLPDESIWINGIINNYIDEENLVIID